MIVAIDGTAGSGKSTTARRVAERLGFAYLDTGAMYRAITYKALKNGTPFQDPEAIGRMVENLKLELNTQNSLTEGRAKEKGSSELRILLDGEDVTELIRSPEVDRNVSLLSTYPKVREKMVNLQRRIVYDILKPPESDEFRRLRGVVCEGRDMGTVVFPEAEVKIYLDASLYIRSKRRLKELEKRDIHLPLNQVERDLSNRDHLDREREVSPLRRAGDAISIDTTNLTIEEEIEKVLEIVKNRLGNAEFALNKIQGRGVVRQLADRTLNSQLRTRLRWRWRLGIWILNAFFNWLLGARVTGRENIPKRGSLLIASNHLSFLDPPLLGWAVKKREVHFLAHEELFRLKKGFTWIIQKFNAIPLSRKGFDRKAFRRAEMLLKKEEAVVIFPEGTRSKIGRLLPPKPGLGLLTLKTGAPVIPARIIGSELPLRTLLFRRERWGIQFGKAMDFTQQTLENQGTAQYQAISDEVMKEISQMHF